MIFLLYKYNTFYSCPMFTHTLYLQTLTNVTQQQAQVGNVAATQSAATHPVDFRVLANLDLLETRL